MSNEHPIIMVTLKAVKELSFKFRTVSEDAKLLDTLVELGIGV